MNDRRIIIPIRSSFILRKEGRLSEGLMFGLETGETETTSSTDHTLRHNEMITNMVSWFMM